MRAQWLQPLQAFPSRKENNMHTKDLLIEIGIEELPTYAVHALSVAFENTLCEGLHASLIPYGSVQAYATPRRLALLIQNVATHSQETTIERRGPALAAAFDKAGNPTAACLGFAKSFQADVSALSRIESDKGQYVAYQEKIPARATETCIAALIEKALQQLPIKTPMRWGNHTLAFVRPIHWITLLWGDKTIPDTILGFTPISHTYGHRFHAPGVLPIGSPREYASLLRNVGYVIADFQERRNVLHSQILAILSAQNLQIIPDDALLDEITSLVEWPVALLGHFDPSFLQIPHEVITATLKQNQRCFTVTNAKDELQHFFITVANIESADPNTVIAGNERVVHARLSDALFFYNQDKEHSLESRLPKLGKVVFQEKLGTLLDRTQRLSSLAQKIAPLVNENPVTAGRAGLLCKCDLASNMVNEFPELQGVMGSYYAFHENLGDNIATSIREHYLPRSQNDSLPQTLLGVTVALADRFDLLAGLFLLDKKPKGDKDPFGLRRAAMSILRIILEHKLDLDLSFLISEALLLQPVNMKAVAETDLLAFICDRLFSLLQEKNISSPVFSAIMALRPSKPLDIYYRATALSEFLQRPEVSSLSQAHKRVNNILSKEDFSTHDNHEINLHLLLEPAEKTLVKLLAQQYPIVTMLCQQQKYTDALLEITQLRDAIDKFFDSVMVMVETIELKQNRLNILRKIQGLFLQVADLSFLSISS